VELTVKVVAAWAGLVASCRPNNKRSTNVIARQKARAFAKPSRIVPKKKLIPIRFIPLVVGLKGRGIAPPPLYSYYFYYDRF
jgi:hypothetical protein